MSEALRYLVFGLAAPGLYWLLLLAGRYLKRSHGVRLGWLYHLLAVCLAIYTPALLLNLPWAFLHHLGAVTVVLSATFLIAVIERYVFELYLREHHGVLVPKFLSEVTRIIVLLIAVFVVLEVAYDQTIKGLLIAPGIAAVVIGLAMQDLMGNIIAGIALQAGGSFKRGDWLLLENRYAQVIEISWRSTQLRTIDDISIEVPNREIARQTIINVNRPQRVYAMRIPFTLDYAAPPSRVKDVLFKAAVHATGVLPEPPPKVFIRNFADHGIEYEIKFFMDNMDLYSELTDAIRTNVWYGLQRHGIRIPFPTRTVQLERPHRDRQQPADALTTAREILRDQPLFKCLNDEQLNDLLPAAKPFHFGRGEKLLQQGANGDSMFILLKGEAKVVAEQNGSVRHLASLAAGDCFGEMSLLTGERRSASVIADTDCEVVEIGKPAMARGLKEHPELLKQLSDLLARRQIETEGILSRPESDTILESKRTKYANTFVQKLKTFFEL